MAKKSDFASKFSHKIERQDSAFLVALGFLELFNIVQHCNTEESDCDFLVGPSFLEVDNSATGKLQSMS